MFRTRASCRYVCQIVGVLDNLTELNAKQTKRIQRGDIVNKKTTGFLVALLAGAFILVGQQPAEASKGKHHKNWRGVYSNNYNYNYKRGKNHRKNWKKHNRHNNWNNGVGNNCWTSNNNGRRRYNRSFNNSIIPTSSYWRGNNNGLVQGLLGPGNGYGNTRFVGGGHPVHGYNHPGHGAYHPVYGVQNTGGLNSLVNGLF